MRTKIEHTKPVTKIRTYYTDHITCDKCGRHIDIGFDYPDYANELTIYLNPDECVHQQFRRDYCTDCLEPIWQALCALIGVDPNDDSPIDDDESTLDE